MLQNKKHILLLFIAFFLLTACGGGGGGGSGGDNPDPVPQITHQIELSVSDAQIGLLDTNVNLSFSGIEVKENGQIITTKTLAPSDDKELSLTVQGVDELTALVITARAQGYLDTGTSVVIQPDIEQAYQADISMIPLSFGSSVDGVYTSQLDISPMIDSNGVTTSEINLESKANSSSPGVTIRIPSGTTLLDSGGAKITDGVLSVTSFDPYEPAALEAYPGGFNVIADATGFTSLDGKSFSGDDEVNFKTAGFTAISIEDASGRKVKSFSQYVDIGMEIKEGTTDSRGDPVTTETPIPMWSYDEDTGKWKFEDQSTFPANDLNNGFLQITHQTDHLSYFNIDWHYGAKCAPRFNFLNFDGSPDLTHYTFKLIVQSSPPVFRNINNYNDDGFLQFYNVPAGFPGSLEIYQNGALIHTETMNEFCETGANDNTGHNTDFGIETDITPNPPPLVQTPIEIRFFCPTAASSNFIYEALTLSPVSSGNNISLDSSGQAIVDIPSGGSIDFELLANNSSQTGLLSSVTPGQLPITIQANTNLSAITLSLTDAYCSNNIGNIDAVQIPGEDPSNRWSVIDVVKASDDAIYVSIVDEGGVNGRIDKIVGNTRTTFILHGAAQYNDTLTPVANVTAVKPSGMDLYKTDHPKGDILVYADYGAHCVNAVFLGSLETVTIAGYCGESGDIDGDQGGAHDTDFVKLHFPTDVAFSPETQELYIADFLNAKLKKLSVHEAFQPLTLIDRLQTLSLGQSVAAQDLKVDTVAGSGNAVVDDTYGSNPLDTNIRPYMLDVAPSGDVIFSDSRRRLSRFDTNNVLSRVAGFYINPSVSPDFSSGGLDAADDAVQFNWLADVEIDDDGNILVADEQNHLVRKISFANGNIASVAGTGAHPGGLYSGPATQVNLPRPYGLWIDETDDSFYVTQILNGVYPGHLRHVSSY